MKKWQFVTVAVVISLLMFSGCTNQPSDKKNDNNAESTVVNSVNAFDRYNNLATFKGLELYVWKTQDASYLCGLMSGTNRNKEAGEIASLPPATVDEMKTILSSYDIPNENIIVIPIVHPYFTYKWEPDDAELQKLREMFGITTVIDTIQVYEIEYKGYIDKRSIDIDDDGAIEDCTLEYGRTSGLFTFNITAKVNGDVKYNDAFYSEAYYLSFVEINGKTYVQGITSGENPKTHLYKISIENGNIVLTQIVENGQEGTILTPLSFNE